MESFGIMALYMYGGMYGVFSGEDLKMSMWSL